MYWNSNIIGLVVKTLLPLQETSETWVQSLGWEDPQEEGMATQSSILAWTISMDRVACWATVHGVAESQTQLNDRHTHTKKHAKHAWI